MSDTVRTRLALAGVLAMLAGSFLPWTIIPLGGGYAYQGTSLSLSVFFDWDEMNLAGSFLISAGMVVIALAVAAAVGAFLGRWWIAKAAAGIVAVALGLLVVRFLGESDPSFGLLLALAGAVAVLASSFWPAPAGGEPS